ncbi:MAG: four helix bundle protein [Patescibacteria group bacterium]
MIEYQFKKLNVWHLGMELVNEIYKLTKDFPKEEQFSLTSQLKRAIISVPLNISEGATRRSRKEFAQFLRIALGSLVEVMTCLEIALNQKYITEGERNKIDPLLEKLYFQIIALEKSLKIKP